MTAIIILNWNGANDTIECLESLYAVQDDFFIVLADNGSADNSIERISQWAENEGLKIALFNEKDRVPTAQNHELLLMCLNSNYGFAKGNNLAIIAAITSAPDYFLILNNDTIVEPNFLSELTGFTINNPRFKALTPKINYYSHPEQVWNCGGRLGFLNRKYYYMNKNESLIKEREYIPISFVTGCALFFNHTILGADNSLFTERFFFGEEDYEFAIRMKKAGNKMACVLKSRIFHKVGSTGSFMMPLGKTYLHYLNRLINLRHHNKPFFFSLIMIVYFPFILRLFRLHTGSLKKSVRLFRKLRFDVYNQNRVTSLDFNRLVIEKSALKEFMI